MSRPSFLHHLHPPTIPQKQARLGYTLGMGGLAVFLSLVVGFTGILEMFYYIPTPDEAALSVQLISYHVPLGWLIRNLHYWSGQILIIVSGLHLLRVIFTGAYTSPRRFNYLLGIGLFVLAILLDFTGYILRWDGGIQWALITGTNLLKTIPVVGEVIYLIVVGGSQPGATTLIRFYAWHSFGLVFIAIILLVWHIFRVRRDGGIAISPSEHRLKENRISRFELVNREVQAMLFAGAALILLAALVPAPISAPISNLSALPDHVRAPWFFLWVQELLHYGSPFWSGVFFPLVFLGILSFIPYIFPNIDHNELGRWFPPSGRLAQITLSILTLAFLILTTLALL